VISRLCHAFGPKPLLSPSASDSKSSHAKFLSLEHASRWPEKRRLFRVPTQQSPTGKRHGHQNLLSFARRGARWENWAWRIIIINLWWNFDRGKSGSLSMAPTHLRRMDQKHGNNWFKSTEFHFPSLTDCRASQRREQRPRWGGRRNAPLHWRIYWRTDNWRWTTVTKENELGRCAKAAGSELQS